MTTQDTYKTIEIGIGKSSLAKEMIADLTQSIHDTQNPRIERIQTISHIPQPYPFIIKEPHNMTTTIQDTPNRIGTDLRHAFFNAGISAAHNADATQDILIEYDNLTYCNLNFF